MNTQTVSLDITKPSSIPPVVTLGQGDANGTTLVAKIYDNGEPFTLTGYSVIFRMKLPRGYASYQVSGTVSGSTATFAIDESYAASVAGVTETAYVEVLSGDTVICSTNRMRVVVLESAYEGTDPAHIWSNGVEEFLEESEAEVDAFIAGAQSDIDAALEAVGDISELAVPLMSSTTRGGAKLGGGLEVSDGKLNLDVATGATGESMTAGNASALESLTVYGKSVQDGTPTPSSPIPVQVVEAPNMADFSPSNFDSATRCTISGTQGEITLTRTSASNYAYAQKDFDSPSAGTYTLSKEDTTNGIRLITYDSGSTAIDDTGRVASRSVSIEVTASTAKLRVYVYLGNTSGGTVGDSATIKGLQLEKGETAHEYVPYRCIGLNCGTTQTPIDLQGNVLASLPDGTRDVLEIDSAGHVTIAKRVKKLAASDVYWNWQSTWQSWYTAYMTDIKPSPSIDAIAGNAICDSLQNTTQTNATTGSWSGTGLAVTTASSSGQRVIAKTGSSTNAPTGSIYLALATEQTIDLGYIDMPDITSGAAISVTASVTPTITASWWAEGAKEVSDAIRALKRAIFENVGNALASSIATVEGATSAHNYSAGSYLMQGEQLYKVTSAIASGEEITPGTNVTATTVMAELLALTA